MHSREDFTCNTPMSTEFFCCSFFKLLSNLNFYGVNFLPVFWSYRNKHPKAEMVSNFQDIPAVGAPTTKTVLVIPATDITPLARDKPILPIACQIFNTHMSFLQNNTLLQIFIRSHSTEGALPCLPLLQTRALCLVGYTHTPSQHSV